ncbi:MAG TPA: hypothetical protein VGE74_00505 [Gemmata sp.]
MTKPVLLAGVLGGLLGGIGGFALTRAFPTQPLPDKPHEARPVADDLFAKLQKGRTDEFLAAVRPGFAELDDAAFETGVRQPLQAAREGFAKGFGGPGQFEFYRELAPAPGLVRFIYLERYPKGCLVWFLYAYRTADGWSPVGFKYMKADAVFEALK